MDEFLLYLCHKYVIFDKTCDKLHETNSVNSVEALCKCAGLPAQGKQGKRIPDDEMRAIAHRVFDVCKCYNVWDTTFSHRLSGHVASAAFERFKKYKQPSICSHVVSVDRQLNTSDTFYVTSLPNINKKQLERVFGPFCQTAQRSDSFRFEYKCKVQIGTKVYVFAVYDWVSETGEFDDDESILWHVASSTESKRVINLFTTWLNNAVEEGCC